MSSQDYDNNLLEYTLRVSVLSDGIAQAARTARQQASIRNSLPQSSSSSSSSDALSLLGSLKDAVGIANQKSRPKLGKEVLKGLESRLRAVAKGEDPKYNGDAFRRTSAIFWGNWQDPEWVKTMRDSRSPEDFILPFVTCTVKTIKKSPTIPEARHNAEVNDQIRQFVQIMRDTVAAAAPHLTDVMQRLDGYLASMKPEPEEDEVSVQEPSDPMQMAATALRVFDVLDEVDVKGKSRALKSLCTAKNAVKDIQLQLDLLSSGQAAFVDAPEFISGNGYETWTKQERSDLEERKTYFAAFTQGRVGDRADGASEIGSTADSATTLVFIPSEPRKCYLDLLRRCLDLDLDDMANLSDNDMVSLAILSEPHIALLDEIAGHWRISQATKLAAHAGLLVNLLQEDGVPVECVAEALSKLRQYLQQADRSLWQRQDLALVLEMLDKVADHVVVVLGGMMSEYDRVPSDQINEACDLLLLLDDLEDIDPYGVANFKAKLYKRIDSLEQVIAQTAKHRYACVWDRRADNLGMALFECAKWIEKHAKSLDKRYPVSILDRLDVLPIVLRAQVPAFAKDLFIVKQAHLASSNSQPSNNALEADDVFQLYKTIHKLADLYKAFVPGGTLGVDLNQLFEPLVLAWLRRMHMEVRQWVDNAIALDDFSSQQDDGCTSSVVDVFTSLHSVVKAVNDLKWTDPGRHADFVAEVALIVMLVVTRYGEILKRRFIMEIAEVKELPDAPTEEIGWMAMANRVARREKPVSKPFDFSPSICLKLNDIEKSMIELDRLYWDLEIDRYMEGHSIHKAGGHTSLYSLRVIRADLNVGDQGDDRSLKSQVVLSDEKGQTIAATRVVSDTAYPRWEETFDVNCESRMWLMASIHNHANDDPRAGRAYIKLDEKAFPEMVARDLWLPLDTGGRLLLRLSREKEKDEPQFYFGKAFRRLKLIETEMVRNCADKMTPFIRTCLCRQPLKKLFRGSTGGSMTASTNDALNKIQAAYRSAISQSENLIPAVREKNHQKMGQRLTDVQIESAIGPLLDYFDDNLQVLNGSLSATNLRAVLLRLWKEILLAVEDMIVPPLSDRPSTMRPLTDGELDVVLKWLKFLRDYFYASGDSSGIPLEELQTTAYQELLRVRIFYDWSTDDLMEECVRDFQKTLKTTYALRGRSKTIKSQRNLGTMKRDKEERRRQQSGVGSSEMILRILRMRPGTQEFLSDQLRTMYRSD